MVLFKKENKLKSKLKKDLKNISNRKYYLIQEFQEAQLKKPEEQNSEYKKIFDKIQKLEKQKEEMCKKINLRIEKLEKQKEKGR